jgi:hypothetical protein
MLMWGFCRAGSALDSAPDLSLGLVQADSAESALAVLSARDRLEQAQMCTGFGVGSYRELLASIDSGDLDVDPTELIAPLDLSALVAREVDVNGQLADVFLRRVADDAAVKHYETGRTTHGEQGWFED